jgi:uncharacterized conserved protein of possible phage origin
MIDRSYLPFQSAREYQDPGMQKWIGFFLSEHTSSLDEDRNRVDLSPGLSKDKKLLFLSQLYIGQLKGCFTVKYRVQKLTIDGMIRELSNKEISVKTSDGYRRVQIEDILQIQLVEDVIYEQKRPL